ncbi:hypothetical protein EYF80_024979 [Liparis tanakae]|uniref:Uncharacterized protein n=1 Tax=Liparis tanakae TaxID=230148 RepID=A0A4Z2HIM7_9TELE|nr:hypothetical protein EYF80_024979 [Liparis tanakae]
MAGSTMSPLGLRILPTAAGQDSVAISSPREALYLSPSELLRLPLFSPWTRGRVHSHVLPDACGSAVGYGSKHPNGKADCCHALAI